MKQRQKSKAFNAMFGEIDWSKKRKKLDILTNTSSNKLYFSPQMEMKRG